MRDKYTTSAEPLSTEPIIMDLAHYIKEARMNVPGTSDSHEIQSVVVSPHEIEHVTAAKNIQRFWRGYKLKEKMLQTPYITYLSMYDQNDEKRALSSMMFGRHIAEIHGKDKIDNPFIQQNSYYHRSDTIEGEIYNELLDEFKIPLERTNDYYYIPLSNLNLTPPEDTLNQFIPEAQGKIRFIKDDNHSLVLAEIPKVEFEDAPWFKHPKWVLKALGLVATPWEISINLEQRHRLTPSKSPFSIEKRFPRSREELLSSSILKKTQKIATHSDYPTQKLAQSVIQLLNKSSNLTPDAIQRIALILDASNKFYAHNYPRYAFCVYTIMHEVSLAYSEQHEHFKELYDKFITESDDTLRESLGLSTLNGYTSFSSPALSGTHAHSIVLRLFHEMEKKTGKHLNIQTIGPSYFEFEFIRDQKSLPEETDVYAITTGPVVTPDGMIPGTDINKFIKHYIIDTKHEKPTVLLIDTTSTLYKNLSLDEPARSLIESGQLSIILIESHQKFGLIHTDQAQYGRVMSICSNSLFDEQIIASFHEKSYLDFTQHLDMQIGAFISTSCSEILESIKQQHFSNGMLLRNILTQCFLATSGVIAHDEMLENFNELYFVTLPEKEDGFELYLSEKEGKTDYYLWDGENLFYISKEGNKESITINNKNQFLNDIKKVSFDEEGKAHLSMSQMLSLVLWNSSHHLPPNALEKAIQNIIYRRDSFGHFQTSMTSFGQVRLSPSATDSIDCLIQASQIYFAHHFHSDPAKLFEHFITLSTKDNLSVDEQIVLIAMMSIMSIYQVESLSKAQRIDLFVKMHSVISNCVDLKDRQTTLEVQAYYQDLRRTILANIEPQERKAFLKAILSTTKSPTTTQDMRAGLQELKSNVSGNENYTKSTKMGR